MDLLISFCVLQGALISITQLQHALQHAISVVAQISTRKKGTTSNLRNDPLQPLPYPMCHPTGKALKVPAFPSGLAVAAPEKAPAMPQEY